MTSVHSGYRRGRNPACPTCHRGMKMAYKYKKKKSYGSFRKQGRRKTSRGRKPRHGTKTVITKYRW